MAGVVTAARIKKRLNFVSPLRDEATLSERIKDIHISIHLQETLILRLVSIFQQKITEKKGREQSKDHRVKRKKLNSFLSIFVPRSISEWVLCTLGCSQPYNSFQSYFERNRWDSYGKVENTLLWKEGGRRRKRGSWLEKE